MRPVRLAVARIFFLFIAVGGVVPAQTVHAAPAAPAAPAVHADGKRIGDAVERFLHQRTAALRKDGAAVSITVEPPNRLPRACAIPKPLSIPNGRDSGKLTVRVRCEGTRPYTLQVRANVAVAATYYVAARDIAAGTPIVAADLRTAAGDLPTGAVTAPEQALGLVTVGRVTAGKPLRRNSLRAPLLIRQGQTVTAITRGMGFSIGAEGRAMAGAALGATVSVKMPSGRIVSGIVQDAETVEITA